MFKKCIFHVEEWEHKQITHSSCYLVDPWTGILLNIVPATCGCPDGLPPAPIALRTANVNLQPTETDASSSEEDSGSSSSEEDGGVSSSEEGGVSSSEEVNRDNLASVRRWRR